MQLDKTKMKELSTTIFLERSDYKKILQSVVITKKTIIIEIIAVIGMFISILIKNTIPSIILLIASCILYITEYAQRIQKTNQLLKEMFPNNKHPNVIRSIYMFEPDGLHVTIEHPIENKKFTVGYNDVIRIKYAGNFAIYITKDNKYIPFQKQHAPNIYFGFKK